MSRNKGNRKEGRKQSKRLMRRVSYIAAVILTACLVMVVSLDLWITFLRQSATVARLVYTWNAPSSGLMKDTVTVCVLALLAGGAASVLIFFIFRKIRHIRRLIRLIELCGCFTGILIGLLDIWYNSGFYLYRRELTNTSTYIEDNYVDPAGIKLTFPEKKRNLIYIYLESVETTFADKESGGAFDQNVIPELTALALQNEDFSGEGIGLDGGYVMPDTTYTIAGMMAATAGLPMKLDLPSFLTNTRGSFNYMNLQPQFFEKVTALGDILEEQGYAQEFLCGSQADFGGRTQYYRDHGNVEVKDYDFAVENGWIRGDNFRFWGYDDETLISRAKTELTELASGDKPFSFTMLTADTHFEDGYSCRLCRHEFGVANQYANVYACSSRQVAGFIDWIMEQDFYENTTIVISGDHLTMDEDFCENVAADYDRKTYTCYINSAVEPCDPSMRREYSTLDNFPTTLAAMGVGIEGDMLGLGTNLFSTRQTLIERDGVGKVTSELEKRSVFMEEKADFDLYDWDMMDTWWCLPEANVQTSKFNAEEGTLRVVVSNIRRVYAPVGAVELEISPGAGYTDAERRLTGEPFEPFRVSLEPTAAGDWAADLDIRSFDYTDCKVKVIAKSIFRTEYDCGNVDGNLALRTNTLTKYVRYLEQFVREGDKDYSVLIAVKYDAADDMNTYLESCLTSFGLTDKLGEYRLWSYAAVWDEDGLNEVHQRPLSGIEGRFSDGTKYDVISHGGASGAGGNANRYIQSYIFIDGKQYSRQGIGLNFVVYDNETGRVIDSVSWNTHMGMEVTRDVTRDPDR